MNQITVRELMMIEDELRAEQITGKTLNWCASQCQDAAIRSMLEQMAEQHQLRVGELSQYFNRTNRVQ
jgi:rubrerythrin